MESQPIIDESTNQAEDHFVEVPLVVEAQDAPSVPSEGGRLGPAPADSGVETEQASGGLKDAEKPVKMAGWCFICKQKRKFEVVETKPTPRNPNTMVYMGPCPKKHKVDENFSYTKRHTVKEKDPQTGEITVRRFAVQKKPRGYISTIRRLKADKKALKAAELEKADAKEAREVEAVAGSDDE
jgi:hypothetical protein